MAGSALDFPLFLHSKDAFKAAFAHDDEEDHMKPLLIGLVGCLALLAPGSVRPLHPLVTPGPFKVAFAEAFNDDSGDAIGQLYESATRLKQSANELDARVKGDLE